MKKHILILLLAFTVTFSHAQTGVTVAGGNGGDTAANQLFHPISICLDSNGDIYVSDYINDRIQKFPPGSDSATNGLTIAGIDGIAGDSAYQFNSPGGILVDRSGNLYVADRYNGRVQKFPPGSVSGTNGVTVAGGNGQGSAANQLSGLTGIFLDRNGNLYVADTYNNRIQKFPPGSDSSTHGVTIAGGNGQGSSAKQFYNPQFVYLDTAGYLYVSDGSNNRVQKFPPGSDSTTDGVTVAGGNGSGSAANQFNYPEGISVSANGDLYVADGFNNRVQKFPHNSDSTTNGITVAGGNGQGTAANQFNLPFGIFVAANGNIYVADCLNNRIQEWTPSGTLIASVISTYPTCYGDSNGSITVTVSGGTPPYTYLLSGGSSQTSGTFTGLPAGIYTITVTDSVNDLLTLTDTLLQPAPVQVSLSWDSLVQEHDLYGVNSSDTIWCPLFFPYIIPLAGGVPTGGIYSGGFVNNDTLNFTNFYYPSVDTVFYTYTNANGCSATAVDMISSEFCEGVQIIPGKATISLYPNPNSGSFVLQSSDAIGQQYIITDMLGRIVADEIITSSDQNIDLQNISAGSYMLSIKSSDSKAVRFAVE